MLVVVGTVVVVMVVTVAYVYVWQITFWGQSHTDSDGLNSVPPGHVSTVSVYVLEFSTSVHLISLLQSVGCGTYNLLGEQAPYTAVPCESLVVARFVAEFVVPAFVKSRVNILFNSSFMW